MAGYSGTPLIKKLGLKENATMYVYDPPKNYFDSLSPLPKGVNVKSRIIGEMDFIHVFTPQLSVFKKQFIECKKHLRKDGMLWISWPKKASKMQTDLDENIIREFGLANGLVDVKVCAVDDVWSGLKFVVRLKDR